MIRIKCRQCGKEFYSYPSNHRKFCCSRCSQEYNKSHHKAPHLSEYNRIHNKERMTSEVKEKLRRGQLNRSKRTTYTKFHGRHEHRIVAEWLIGRPLKTGEVVHHIDGNKRNNSPSNLMVFKNQSDHALYHSLSEGGDSNEIYPSPIPTIFD